MYILGLTGSIGMGKSFVADEFERFGIPIFDADKTVHKLLEKGGKAVFPVRKMFPDAYIEKKIDRRILGDNVFQNKMLLVKLEAILHPLVEEEQKNFLRRSVRKGFKVVVLDVPLLFEKKYDCFMDAVILVSASYVIQRKRVMQRQCMTEVRFNAIRALQMSEWKKKTKADYIIYTGLGKSVTRKMIRKIAKDFLKR